MKALFFSVLLLLAASGIAAAGEVYGTITEGGKPVAAGLKVEIKAKDAAYQTETDKFGGYRIFVKEKGKCALTLHVAEQAPSAELISYDKSTRYDWLLETADGKLSLRRK